MKQKKINILKKNYNKKIETKKKSDFHFIFEIECLDDGPSLSLHFQNENQMLQAAQRSHRPACF
jgi:hypothetical protein